MFPISERIALSLIWPPRQFDIDARARPIVEEATIPWLHEAIARELPHVSPSDH
jgi:hypothetical protein